MKGKPRISLSMKKTRQGRKARAAVAVCDRVFSIDSANHADVAGIVYLGAPAETLMAQRFTGLLVRECPPAKIPDGWLRPAMQSKEKSKLVGHAK